MKNLKVLFSFIIFLCLITPFAHLMESATGVPAVLVTLVLIAGAILYTALKRRSNLPKGVHTADVNVEVWANYLIQRFWKDNAFLKNVYNDNQYVLAGKVVHIPQIGNKPQVVKNRSVYPAVAVQRADTDITYALDVYTSDPVHIEDADKYELSYDKINTVFGDTAGALNEDIADDLIIKWLTGLTGKALLPTTGASADATAPDATGKVKLLVGDDVRTAMTRMNVDNVPKNDRFIMPSANMLDHLIRSLSDTQYRDFSSYLDAKNGVIGKLYGFTFLDRSATAVADIAGAVKPIGAIAEATDKEVTLCWQKDALAAALGEVKFFDNVNDPQYYGDVYSGLQRAGGRRRRSDNKGVIEIYQAVGA
ncbi:MULTISPECIES: hypothetical protein [Sphingobacterium]|uniref:hypothetical protein n=1 Tax=Sphingobacterium TaxID=28453 RepID=UPI00257F4479|nr:MULTISPECIES: hypothetical protein [Sphingobacterium]